MEVVRHEAVGVNSPNAVGTPVFDCFHDGTGELIVPEGLWVVAGAEGKEEGDLRIAVGFTIEMVLLAKRASGVSGVEESFDLRVAHRSRFGADLYGFLPAKRTRLVGAHAVVALNRNP